MAETPRHRWLLGFELHDVAFEKGAREFVEVRAFIRGVVHVQFEIELAEGELAHDVAGAAVVLGGDQLLEETRGNRFSGFMMAGEEVEALALPAEVFHELRGQFYEVPVNAHAIERGDFHVATELVQQMPEFMEDGGDFIMREQRRLAIDRRRHVAADEAEVQTAVALATGRHTHSKVIHPGTAALGITRMPVGIE